MAKKRILCFDLIRIFACICVTVVHFNAQMSGWSQGGFIYPNSICPNIFLDGKVYLGGIGVSLFFMLSGATLMYTYRPGNVLKFYKKRFLSIYPMFWIAFLAAHIWDFFMYKSLPGEPFSQLFFSLIGMDGYFTNIGVASILGLSGFGFYKLGEWFLGCIVILYLFFPLLHWCFEKSPIATGIGAVVMYAAYYHLGGLFYYTPDEKMFFLRFIEILLGMAFVKYRLYERQRTAIIISAVAFIFAWLLRDGISSLTLTIALCMLLFSGLTILSDFIPDGNAAVTEGLARASNLTFPIFLVHHWLIIYLIRGFNLEYLSVRNKWMMFLSYVILTVVLSMLLENACNRLLAKFRRPKAV